MVCGTSEQLKTLSCEEPRQCYRPALQFMYCMVLYWTLKIRTSDWCPCIGRSTLKFVSLSPLLHSGPRCLPSTLTSDPCTVTPSRSTQRQSCEPSCSRAGVWPGVRVRSCFGEWSRLGERSLADLFLAKEPDMVAVGTDVAAPVVVAAVVAASVVAAAVVAAAATVVAAAATVVALRVVDSVVTGAGLHCIGLNRPSASHSNEGSLARAKTHGAGGKNKASHSIEGSLARAKTNGAGGRISLIRPLRTELQRGIILCIQV